MCAMLAGVILPMRTDDVGRNPVPVMSRVNDFPAYSLPGLSAVICGTGLAIVNATTFEIPAEGEGFCTVTDPEVVPLISLARIEAVN